MQVILVLGFAFLACMPLSSAWFGRFGGMGPYSRMPAVPRPPPTPPRLPPPPPRLPPPPQTPPKPMPLPGPAPKKPDWTVQAPPLPPARTPQTPGSPGNEIIKRPEMPVQKVDVKQTPSTTGYQPPIGQVQPPMSRSPSKVSINTIEDSIKSPINTLAQQAPPVIMMQGKQSFWRELTLYSAVGAVGSLGQVASAGILAHAQTSAQSAAQQQNWDVWAEYYNRLRENNATEEAWRKYNSDITANLTVSIPSLNLTFVEGTNISIPIVSETTTALPTTLSPQSPKSSESTVPFNTSVIQDEIRNLADASRLYKYITIPAIAMICLFVVGFFCCCCVFVIRDRKNPKPSPHSDGFPLTNYQHMYR